MELQLISGVHSASRPTPPLSLCLSQSSGGSEPSSVAEPLRAVALRAGSLDGEMRRACCMAGWCHGLGAVLGVDVSPAP